jgi:hypothetical protein
MNILNCFKKTFLNLIFVLHLLKIHQKRLLKSEINVEKFRMIFLQTIPVLHGQKITEKQLKSRTKRREKNKKFDPSGVLYEGSSSIHRVLKL